MTLTNQALAIIVLFIAIWHSIKIGKSALAKAAQEETIAGRLIALLAALVFGSAVNCLFFCLVYWALGILFGA